MAKSITPADAALMSRDEILREIKRIEAFLPGCTNIFDLYGNVSAREILRDALARAGGENDG